MPQRLGKGEQQLNYITDVCITGINCRPNCAGKPEPLGPSKTASGVNFALFSRHAKSVKLCIFDTEANQLAEVDCNRTGRCRFSGVARERLPGSVGLGRWAPQQASQWRTDLHCESLDKTYVEGLSAYP